MSSFSDGYKSFSSLAGAAHAVVSSEQYVLDVEQAIGMLSKEINNLRFNKNGEVGNRLVHDLKGRAAEYWHKGTFNIDAAVRDDPTRVSKVPETGRRGLGDADLDGPGVDEYGVKYFKTAEASAKQQAKTLGERYNEYLAECKRNSREPITYDEYVKDLNNTAKNAPLYEGQFRLIPSDQLEEAKGFPEKSMRKWLFAQNRLSAIRTHLIC